jgi:multidrug resistance efflux pump
LDSDSNWIAAYLKETQLHWVRLPQRFPVRIQVDKSAQTELRIGQTVSVAISRGAELPRKC